MVVPIASQDGHFGLMSPFPLFLGSRIVCQFCVYDPSASLSLRIYLAFVLRQGPASPAIDVCFSASFQSSSSLVDFWRWPWIASGVWDSLAGMDQLSYSPNSISFL